MSYNAMRELHNQWTLWVDEESKCPHCGGVLPWVQSGTVRFLPTRHNIQDIVSICPHLPAKFDYICGLCGEKVNHE